MIRARANVAPPSLSPSDGWRSSAPAFGQPLARHALAVRHVGRKQFAGALTVGEPRAVRVGVAAVVEEVDVVGVGIDPAVLNLAGRRAIEFGLGRRLGNGE